MKKTKKLALGLGALLMSLTAASGVTGTLAWFTAANTVTVSGLSMQAAAEQGIVIANEAHTTDAAWQTSATASHNGNGAQFIPTSTANTTNWYHGYASSAANGQLYEDIAEITAEDTHASPAHGTDGDGVYGFLDTTTWKNVYLLNSFFIQSSSVNAIQAQDVYVRDFETKVGENAPSQDLSKSLRVAVIKHGKTTPVIIVAPVAGADPTYEVGLIGHKTSITATTKTDVESLVVDSNVDIPAYTTNGANALQYDVFVYFEGEDENCKSNNIAASLESLSVAFKFGNKAKGA